MPHMSEEAMAASQNTELLRPAHETNDIKQPQTVPNLSKSIKNNDRENVVWNSQN